MIDCVCCICGPRIPHHFIIVFKIALRHNYVIQTSQHSGSCVQESLQVQYGIGQQRCYTMFTRPFFFPSQCKKRKGLANPHPLPQEGKGRGALLVCKQSSINSFRYSFFVNTQYLLLEQHSWCNFVYFFSCFFQEAIVQLFVL